MAEPAILSVVARYDEGVASLGKKGSENVLVAIKVARLCPAESSAEEMLRKKK